MSVAERRRQDAAAGLSNLTLSPAKPRGSGGGPAPPDFWDDAASDDDDEAATPADATPARVGAHDLPHAPPPTPITPAYAAHGGGGSGGLPSASDTSSAGFENPYGSSEPLTPLRGHFRPGGSSGSGSAGTGPPEVRPDKSSAAAARLIAGALGVRRPAESADSRAYERAVRERERGRREREREARRREESERDEARRAVWED